MLGHYIHSRACERFDLGSLTSSFSPGSPVLYTCYISQPLLWIVSRNAAKNDHKHGLIWGGLGGFFVSIYIRHPVAYIGLCKQVLSLFPPGSRSMKHRSRLWKYGERIKQTELRILLYPMKEK